MKILSFHTLFFAQFSTFSPQTNKFNDNGTVKTSKYAVVVVAVAAIFQFPLVPSCV